MYLRARLSNLQSAFRKISIPLILRLYIESRPCSIIDSLLVLLDFPRLCRTFARHPHTISHNHQKARCVCLLVIFVTFTNPMENCSLEFQRRYLPRPHSSILMKNRSISPIFNIPQTPYVTRLSTAGQISAKIIGNCFCGSAIISSQRNERSALYELDGRNMLGNTLY